jgi:hypothetical protein
MFFALNGGCSRISGIPSQEAHHRRFHVGWWALPDLRHRLPGAPSSTCFASNGGRSRISDITSQGAPSSTCFMSNGGRSQISDITSQRTHHRHFSHWMVGTPGSPSLPPRGGTVDVFYVEWWALPNLRHRLPEGPPLTFLQCVVRLTLCSAPQGGCCQCPAIKW